MSYLRDEISSYRSISELSDRVNRCAYSPISKELTDVGIVNFLTTIKGVGNEDISIG